MRKSTFYIDMQIIRFEITPMTLKFYFLFLSICNQDMNDYIKCMLHNTII